MYQSVNLNKEKNNEVQRNDKNTRDTKNNRKRLKLEVKNRKKQ